jgi:hypothetical protein
MNIQNQPPPSSTLLPNGYRFLIGDGDCEQALPVPEALTRTTTGQFTILTSAITGTGRTPQIDRGAIAASVALDPKKGVQAVEELHGAIYDAEVANERGVLEGKDEALRKRIAAIGASIFESRRQIGDLEKFICTAPRDGRHPLTTRVSIGTGLIQLLAGSMLLVDMFVCAQVLCESGLSNFAENPLKAWAYSSSAVWLAAAIKGFLGFVPRGRAKEFFLGVLGLAAATGAMWWASLFAGWFPGIGQSTAEILGGLSGAGAGGVPSEVSGRMILLQVLTGAFSSVVLWELALHIRSRYHRQTLVKNPAWIDAVKELSAAEELYASEVEARGRVAGLLAQMDARRKAFIARAVAIASAVPA